MKYDDLRTNDLRTSPVTSLNGIPVHPARIIEFTNFQNWHVFSMTAYNGGRKHSTSFTHPFGEQGIRLRKMGAVRLNLSVWSLHGQAVWCFRLLGLRLVELGKSRLMKWISWKHRFHFIISLSIHHHCIIISSFLYVGHRFLYIFPVSFSDPNQVPASCRESLDTAAEISSFLGVSWPSKLSFPTN